MSDSKTVGIDYFHDQLCVWAYIAQRRVDELKFQFGAAVHINYHFLPVFGCTQKRIASGWQDRGGYTGFGAHVREVCSRFPHVTLHPDIWQQQPPTTSVNSHLFLKAVQLLEARGELPPQEDGKTAFEHLMWQVRLAFFAENRDISRLDTLHGIAEAEGLARAPIEAMINEGHALAGLCRDVELRDQLRIEGSPTFVMNEGRQKLYGNVGYRILEANVQELLQNPGDVASWC